MKTSRILSIMAVVALGLVVVGVMAANNADVGSAIASFGVDPATLMAFGAVGTTFTETNHAGEYLISEGEGTISRDVITVASTYDLAAGTVLGRIRGAAAAAAALGTNTGNGVFGAVTLGAGALEGTYKVAVIEPASNLGNFVVEDPLGHIVGHGTVGSAFSAGGVAFTLADGATDFVAGDSFSFVVAKGTKYGPFDPAATDGREAAASVLFDDCDATSADTSAVAHSRLCEVAQSKLTWAATASDPQKAVALAQLAAHQIIAR